MMKKYIVFTLLLPLVGMSISLQAMGGEERRSGKRIKVTKCSICLDEGAEEGNLQTLSCGDEFHAECLGRYIRNAFSRSNTNFDQLKCPLFSTRCKRFLTREEINVFISSSSSLSSSTASNEDILAFFDQRAAERANPTVIIRQKPDAATLAEIAAGYLQICPGCNRTTSRIDGCNHITCSTDDGGCGVHYCYVCATPYNPLINNGIGWEARACACPHFPGPGWAAGPIPVPDGHGGARPQVNPMALINAARTGHLAAVQALIAAPLIQINTQNNQGWTALYVAANQGHLAVVQALLAAPGIQVNIQNNTGWTALHWAANEGHLELVQALIADPRIQVNTPDNEGNTALHWAGDQGNLAVVQALLAAPGIQVNTPDNRGNTALHWAATAGDLEVVRELLAAGAQVNTQSNRGSTALHWAARKGHLAVVHPLIAAPGIQVNTQNNTGYTPLHWAARQGDLEVVEALIAAPGIQVNTPEANGMTALHMAADQGYLEVVGGLLAAGADVTTQNKLGRTARDQAERGYFREIVATIDAHIAAQALALVPAAESNDKTD